MPSQINQFRRRFLGTAAMTLAAGRLGLFDVGHAQSGTTMPVGSSRTHTSFASLKQIGAGALFDDATFDRTVASFDTPDHVSIVIHNYRWRLGLAEGEPAYDSLENRLATAPVITVRTITLEGDANGAPHPAPAAYAAKFSSKYVHRNLTGGIGHNLPQEAPQAFAAAVLDVDAF